MTYNIGEAATSLMVEESELLEILDIFFAETRDSLGKCEVSLKNGDCDDLKKLFHAMKGSASNFRMNDLNRLAAKMESGAKSGDLTAVKNTLSMFRKEFEAIMIQVKEYTLKK